MTPEERAEAKVLVKRFKAGEHVYFSNRMWLDMHGLMDAGRVDTTDDSPIPSRLTAAGEALAAEDDE